MRACISTCQVLGLGQPAIQAMGTPVGPFIVSTSSLITNFSPCIGWAVALEGLSWVGAWDPWVLQHLQTRLGGPTGRL